jgi:hypothetical protein
VVPVVEREISSKLLFAPSTYIAASDEPDVLQVSP